VSAFVPYGHRDRSEKFGRIQRLFGTIVVVWLAMMAAGVRAEPKRVALVERKTLNDEGVEKGKLKSYVKWKLLRAPLNYPVGMATRAMRRDFGGINAAPVTYVVDREGKIVFGHLGVMRKETLQIEIERALGAGEAGKSNEN
jgi:hypothetical protein